MLVSDMLNDIVSRLPVDVLKRYGEPGILRMANRLYTRLNSDYKLVFNSYTPDFSSGASEFTLPDDFVAVLSVDTSVDFLFVDSNAYDPDSPDTTLCIKGKTLIFTNTDTSSSFVLYYQSTGKTLVNSTSPASTEVNEPEWPEVYHDILFYGVCVKLTTNYEMYETDLMEFDRGKRKLSAAEISAQEVSPHIMGSKARPVYDGYGELLSY